MKLKIISPEGIIFSDTDIYSVTIPTSEGVITVMEDHEPLVTILAQGQVEIIKQLKNHSPEITKLDVARGIIEIREDSQVNIIADFADKIPAEMHLKEIELARQKAIEYLNKVDSNVELTEQVLEAKLEKELGRKSGKNTYKNLKKIV